MSPADSALLLALALAPVVWTLSHYLIGRAEFVYEVVKHRKEELSFEYLMSRGGTVLFAIYVVYLVTALESWALYSGYTVEWVYPLKLLLAGGVLAGSYGTVMYDKGKPRALMAVYAALPWSGSILFYRTMPNALFTWSLLPGVVLYCVAWRYKRAKAKEKDKAQRTLPEAVEATKRQPPATRQGTRRAASALAR